MSAGAISVVVCTKTRPEMIESCLDALQDLDYPAYEIVVVDNTSDRSIGGRIRSNARVRTVHEPRPGLSRARNLGIHSARHDIIAFLDDDVVAQKGWLAAMAAAFADERIAAVTGLVLPFELETDAQRAFEWSGGMGKGETPRMMAAASLSARQLIAAEAVGVGANMAFRRSVFEQIGKFDEVLGAGTGVRGAEDLDFFHRALSAGLTIRYEPSAIVWHRHRRDREELVSQIFANGRSYTVYLMKIWAHRSAPRPAVLIFGAMWFAGRASTALFRTVVRPGLLCRIAWAEVRGALSGPAAYRRAYGRRSLAC